LQGKSRVEGTRLQRLSFVFLALAMIGGTFSDLYGPVYPAGWTFSRLLQGQ
jgi:hypothetical protein